MFALLLFFILMVLRFPYTCTSLIFVAATIFKSKHHRNIEQIMEEQTAFENGGCYKCKRSKCNLKEILAPSKYRTTKQACRNESVVCFLFSIYYVTVYFNVSSTILRKRCDEEMQPLYNRKISRVSGVLLLHCGTSE